MGELAITGGKPLAAELVARIPPWPQFNEDDRKALIAVLEGRRWCRIYAGYWADKFEEAFATYHDAQHCLAVANGTVSPELALKSCGIGAGDEVLVPAVTFIATVSAITEVGATPIFVDIDPDTATVSPEAVEAALTARTRALIAVHYAGYPCDFDRLLPLCRRHNLALIEDAAHAQGTEWQGRKVGALGPMGSFSFQETKSLPSGEGGAIVTDDEGLAEKARLIHNIGRVVGRPGYLHYTLSSNYRISEFQAALLLAQLQRLPEWTRVKHENGRWLCEQFRGLGGLEPLREDPRVTSRGYHFYVLGTLLPQSALRRQWQSCCPGPLDGLPEPGLLRDRRVRLVRLLVRRTERGVERNDAHVAVGVGGVGRSGHGGGRCRLRKGSGGGRGRRRDDPPAKDLRPGCPAAGDAAGSWAGAWWRAGSAAPTGVVAGKPGDKAV